MVANRIEDPLCKEDEDEEEEDCDEKGEHDRSNSNDESVESPTKDNPFLKALTIARKNREKANAKLALNLNF